MDERELAISLFNGTWALVRKPDRSREEDDAMVHMAHASRHHWAAVGGPENLARGEWQCARVYAVLGRAEPSIYHAKRCLDLCQEHGLGDWDLAFAHEALARASALGGDPAAARRHRDLARTTPIADEEDRELLEADLATLNIDQPGGA